MAAAMPFIGPALTLFGGIMGARQNKKNADAKREAEMMAAKTNAERTRLETEEKLRRKRIEDERVLSGMTARMFASGTRGTGSGAAYIRSTEDELAAESDWIARSGEWQAQDWDRQFAAAEGSSYTPDYITPFAKAAGSIWG